MSFFCSQLLPRVAPGPGSTPRCAGSVHGSHFHHLALPACAWLRPLSEAVPALGSPRLQSTPPLADLSLFPTCPDSGCVWPWSSFSKSIRRLHRLNVNQLCDVADTCWDVRFCPVSHFCCYICTLGWSCPRVSLILVLFSYIS